jgi:hypothetical protein
VLCFRGNIESRKNLFFLLVISRAEGAEQVKRQLGEPHLLHDVRKGGLFDVADELTYDEHREQQLSNVDTIREKRTRGWRKSKALTRNAAARNTDQDKQLPQKNVTVSLNYFKTRSLRSLLTRQFFTRLFVTHISKLLHVSQIKRHVEQGDEGINELKLQEKQKDRISKMYLPALLDLNVTKKCSPVLASQSVGSDSSPRFCNSLQQ